MPVRKPLNLISNDGGGDDAAEAAALSVPEEEAADPGDHTSRLPADNDDGAEEEAAGTDNHASRLPAGTEEEAAAGSDDAPEDNGAAEAAELPWQSRRQQRKEPLLRLPLPSVWRICSFWSSFVFRFYPVP